MGIENSGVSDNPFRWGSMYWDAHTQTYMTMNRMFSPARGRWTSPDPFFHAMHGNLQSSTAAILQSANLFVMTMNNPVRWHDPTGLFAQDAHFLDDGSEMRHFCPSSFGSSISIEDIRKAMAAGAGLLVFVGGRAIHDFSAVIAQHASIQIFIAPGHELWDTGHFRSIWGGIGYSTIGGFTVNQNLSGIRGLIEASGEPMVGAIRHSFDRERYLIDTFAHIPEVNANQVRRMFAGAQALGDHQIPYNLLGNRGHNSNSFVAGLLNHAGVNFPVGSTSIWGGFPGGNNPIPIRHFSPIPIILPIQTGPVVPSHF